MRARRYLQRLRDLMGRLAKVVTPVGDDTGPAIQELSSSVQVCLQLCFVDSGGQSKFPRS